KCNNTSTRAAAFRMKKRQKQARRIRPRAQGKARERLAAAQLEGEALKKQSKPRGLAEGRAEGLRAGLEDGKKSGHQQAMNDQQAKLREVVAALSSATTQIDSQRRQLEAESAGELIKLSVAIARRVSKR